ncbi:hypothetical protein INT46_006325 [Mucor plumbeus]|uniref:Uncharacterized protein n=1 Tax=Mucor plumbeus TaxID=97098 RepID=A0A8H7UPV5_9FUNG|nr:hypothetical protein INT46_006325 [Mucor plumbeus]
MLGSETRQRNALYLHWAEWHVSIQITYDMLCDKVVFTLEIATDLQGLKMSASSPRSNTGAGLSSLKSATGATEIPLVSVTFNLSYHPRKRLTKEC